MGLVTPMKVKSQDTTQPGVVPYFYLDAAEKVLDTYAHKSPMHYKEITRGNSAFLCYTPKMSNYAMRGNYADHFKEVCMAFCFPCIGYLKKETYQRNRVDVSKVSKQ